MSGKFLIFFFLLNALFSPPRLLASDYVKSSFPELYAQHLIEEEGSELVERGLWEEAIFKYKEALDPKYIKEERDKSGPIHALTKIYTYQQKYDDALKEWQWILKLSDENAKRQGRKNNGEAALVAQKILALKKYKETNNPQFVYDYIKLYSRKKKEYLPPSFPDSIEVSTVLQLYDVIRDYDAGIALINTCLSFFKKHQQQFGADPKLFDQIKTSAEATQCSDLDKRKRNPQSGTCNLIREHLLIREAFEKDKANGGPDCEAGKYCIGSATKAIIQSDYFPW